MTATLTMIIIVVAGVVDFYCYTKAPYPQRAGIGRIPFVGGPLALWKYGKKANGV
jgi:hypothetical protein